MDDHLLIASNETLRRVVKSVRYLLRKEDEFFTGRSRFRSVAHIRDGIRPGDHIFAVRTSLGGSLRFAHHGIVLNEDLDIVHFSPVRTGMVWTSKVRKDTLEVFIGDGTTPDRVGLKYYANTRKARVPGDASKVSYYSRDALETSQVVENAYQLLYSCSENSCRYSVFNQNCEHLAVSCKIGRDRAGSAQVDNFLESLAFLEQCLRRARKRPTASTSNKKSKMSSTMWSLGRGLITGQVESGQMSGAYLLLRHVMGEDVFDDDDDDEDGTSDRRRATKEFVRRIGEVLVEIDDEFFSSQRQRDEQLSSTLSRTIGARVLRWFLRLIALPIHVVKSSIRLDVGDEEEKRKENEAEEEEEEEESDDEHDRADRFEAFLRLVQSISRDESVHVNLGTLLGDLVDRDTLLLSGLRHVEMYDVELSIRGKRLNRYDEVSTLFRLALVRRASPFVLSGTSVSMITRCILDFSNCRRGIETPSLCVELRARRAVATFSFPRRGIRSCCVELQRLFGEAHLSLVSHQSSHFFRLVHCRLPRWASIEVTSVEGTASTVMTNFVAPEHIRKRLRDGVVRAVDTCFGLCKPTSCRVDTGAREVRAILGSINAILDVFGMWTSTYRWLGHGSDRAEHVKGKGRRAMVVKDVVTEEDDELTQLQARLVECRGFSTHAYERTYDVARFACDTLSEFWLRRRLALRAEKESSSRRDMESEVASLKRQVLMLTTRLSETEAHARSRIQEMSVAHDRAMALERARVSKEVAKWRDLTDRVHVSHPNANERTRRLEEENRTLNALVRDLSSVVEGFCKKV